ncbi:hypothetical protein [Thauera sp. 63]|uniref:Uncharacterized protein n=1 Tax=Thauera propionica TaxID=2019431 RepID=A0A235F414_9RHOO|nr:hypothetical protein [Thauera sp. 63]ENO78421.1 hypothetical protein C664_08728 [Thauera sp. 63]OYD55415.1 hypothetical protein CGK74_04305 [Thauera propionica]
MNLDELVANYIKLRDKKSQLRKQYDEKVVKIDAVMDKMEAIILKTFQNSGIDSAHTNAGTAYLSIRTSAYVTNREDFFTWVLDDTENRISFFADRVNKAMVEEFKAANGNLPPGVTYRSEVTVGVRRI